MGNLVKLIDVVLFIVFLGVAVIVPVLDSQVNLPLSLYPDMFINLKHWHAGEFGNGDYLFKERPSFFVGLIWCEIFFIWPLSLINMYGVLGSKSWYPTTSSMFGSSVLAAMAAISGEIIGSGKASDRMLMLYLPFLGFSALATLRGLIPDSCKTTSESAMARKKKA